MFPFVVNVLSLRLENVEGLAPLENVEFIRVLSFVSLGSALLEPYVLVSYSAF